MDLQHVIRALALAATVGSCARGSFSSMRQVPPDAESIPMTGRANAALASFDELITQRMREKGIPGAALAISKNGRLIYARGYGYADLESKSLVQPDSLFRLASVSKPITGTSIAMLSKDPKVRLDLDQSVFKYLGLHPFLKPGQREDSRIWKVTIRQLLQHTGGWDRAKSGDLMFKWDQIASDTGSVLPPDHRHLIEWGMGKPLDFAPGTKYAYSNFGFCVLGRVIEKASGMSYEQFVRQIVLKPYGITKMRIGGGMIAERARGEVKYYASSGAKRKSVFGEPNVPEAYAFNSPSLMDAHGGWIASVVDLLRFTRGIGQVEGREARGKGLGFMFDRPQPPVGLDQAGKPEPVYYNFGWQVRDLGKGKVNIWHAGGMPGSTTILVRLDSGLSWALLMNKEDAGDIDGLLRQAAETVREWPTGDLFPSFN